MTNPDDEKYFSETISYVRETLGHVRTVQFITVAVCLTALLMSYYASTTKLAGELERFKKLIEVEELMRLSGTSFSAEMIQEQNIKTADSLVAKMTLQNRRHISSKTKNDFKLKIKDDFRKIAILDIVDRLADFNVSVDIINHIEFIPAKEDGLRQCLSSKGQNAETLEGRGLRQWAEEFDGDDFTHVVKPNLHYEIGPPEFDEVRWSELQHTGNLKIRWGVFRGVVDNSHYIRSNEDSCDIDATFTSQPQVYRLHDGWFERTFPALNEICSELEDKNLNQLEKEGFPANQFRKDMESRWLDIIGVPFKGSTIPFALPRVVIILLFYMAYELYFLRATLKSLNFAAMTNQPAILWQWELLRNPKRPARALGWCLLIALPTVGCFCLMLTFTAFKLTEWLMLVGIFLLGALVFRQACALRILLGLDKPGPIGSR